MSDHDVCPLCGRLLAPPSNKHHLVPLSKGGKATPTILLHKVCHDKIHSVFREGELKRYYHTIDRILEREEMQKFVKWLQRKPPEYYDKSLKVKR